MELSLLAACLGLMEKQELHCDLGFLREVK
jgi:hypothetical protein